MQLRNLDVICGRGLMCYNHEGNKRFRAVLENHLEEYSKAKSRMDKSLIVSRICKEIRLKGEFIRKDRNEWVAVPERLAREKCGQNLRDMLSGQYKSSGQSKQARRKIDLKQQTEEMTKLIRTNQRVCEVLDNIVVDDDMSDAMALKYFNQANMAILNELKVCDLHLRTAPAGNVALVPSVIPSMFDTMTLPEISKLDSKPTNFIRMVSDEFSDEESPFSLDYLDNFDDERLTDAVMEAVEMI